MNFIWPRLKNRELLFSGVLLLLCVGLWSVPAPDLLNKQTGSIVSARVTATDNSALMEHGLVVFGSQILQVELLDGRWKGKCFPAANELRGNLELDKIFEPGDRITVAIGKEAEPGKSVLTAKDFDRAWISIALFSGFCLLLVIFGGWTGVKTLFSFLFSCLMIFKVIIPLVLHGFPAAWMIFFSVVILTAVIMFLVAGVTKKACVAFLGAVSGVCAGLIMAHLFGSLLHINGATMPYSQTLLNSGFEYLDMADLFVGAVILASSGAMMDLAMDIAAAIDELALHNPQLTAGQLIASGMRIGRNVAGTMTTTLLLAYSGGYLTLLMMFVVQGVSWTAIINNPLVAAEVVKTLIGSFSLVLVAPFTALISGWIFAKRKHVA